MTAITAEELKRGRRVNGGGGGSGSSVRSSGPGGGHRKSLRESAAVDQAGHPSQESDLATEDDEVTPHQSDIKVVESLAALKKPPRCLCSCPWCNTIILYVGLDT